MPKVRHVDFSPDEFLVGTAGMTAEQKGVYWTICALIYSSGGAIAEDDERLLRLSGVSLRRLPGVLREICAMPNKLVLNGGRISNERAEKELARASKRMTSAQDNGALGGRPVSENNDLEKPAGSGDEKLSLPINHQPPSKSPQPPALGLVGGRSVSVQELFETWYEHYPRKEAPARARKAYEKAIRKPGVNSELLLHAVRRYAAMVTAESKERQFIPHPATWLNDERWRDQAAPPVPGSPRGNGAPPGPGNGGDRGFL